MNYNVGDLVVIRLVEPPYWNEFLFLVMVTEKDRNYVDLMVFGRLDGQPTARNGERIFLSETWLLMPDLLEHGH